MTGLRNHAAASYCKKKKKNDVEIKRQRPPLNKKWLISRFEDIFLVVTKVKEVALIKPDRVF